MFKRATFAFPLPFWVLFTGTLVNRFGSFVFVFIVLYLTAKGYSAVEAGLAVSVYGAGSILASILGGILTDKLGRRSTIIVSMFSSAVILFVFPLASALPLILALSGLAGLMAEMYRPASSALIADLVPSHQRVKAYTWYRLAINVGTAAGAAVAGFLSTQSFTWLFVIDGLSSLLFGILAIFALPSVTHSVQTRQSDEAQGFIRTLTTDIPFILYWLAFVLIAFIYFQSISTLPLQVQAQGLPNSLYGFLMSLNGIIVVLLELPLNMFTQRFPKGGVIATGMILLGLGFGLIIYTPVFFPLALTVIVWTLGEIVYSAVAAAYLADLAPAHFQGRYQGVSGLAWSTGFIFGPLLGSYLFSQNPTLLWLLCLLAGLLGAALILISTRLLKARHVATPLETV